MAVSPRAANQPTDLFFLVLPDVHVLDLSGPAQAFYEAGGFSTGYRLRYCGVASEVTTAQGLRISELEVLPEVTPGSFVLVPGIDSATLDRLDHVPIEWLRAAAERAATIGSICSGAFVLARAGLLDGKSCTTHWKVADRLAREYPAARVVGNRLFVRDRGLITSAGVASGIDMSLSMIEEQHGPVVTARAARELVIYLRRNGDADQRSIYLDYRTHLQPGVHRVQDWLVNHPDERPTVEELAEIAGMSPRNLTRVFRRATGTTLKAFSNELKLEVARSLLSNPDFTVDRVASQCGFSDPRQLRRLWRKSYGVAPSEWRSHEANSELPKEVRN